MSFDLATRLAERRVAHLYRQRPLLESPQGPQVRVDGGELLAFCSNDYLGLANHPEVIQAMRDGAAQWGVGGGASHLVIGHSTPHHQLEEALAEFTGRPRALRRPPRRPWPAPSRPAPASKSRWCPGAPARSSPEHLTGTI